MKKVLLGLFALSAVTMAAETNLYFRAGADLNGEFDVVQEEELKVNKEDADDFAWEIAVEATREVYPKIELGFGIAYQDHGAPKKMNYYYTYDSDVFCDEFKMEGYTSIPLYAVAKYNFDAINNFTPYIKANLGYSFNDENGDLKYNEYMNSKVTYTEKYDVNIKNGLYYGIGAGFEYNNFTMDLMYQVNKADAEITEHTWDGKENNYKKDFDYSRITLGFGYKFNLDI